AMRRAVPERPPCRERRARGLGRGRRTRRSPRRGVRLRAGPRAHDRRWRRAALAEGTARAETRRATRSDIRLPTVLPIPRVCGTVPGARSLQLLLSIPLQRHRRAAMARKNSTLPAKASARSAAEARGDLVARAARNAEGGMQCRSDPLADAQAARAVVKAVEEHAAELARRGLNGAYCEAALQLAREIEDHLQAMPAAAMGARGRSEETAELLADAAGTAQAVRTAVLRVTRSADGRRVARDFGIGDPFSARQPAHVLRALTRILAALETHREVRADIG